MLYDKELTNAMVGVLENRVPAIATHITSLLEQGYIPNRNKTTILNWSTILIHAYENIDVFSKEQQNKLDVLYNRVLKL